MSEQRVGVGALVEAVASLAAPSKVKLRRKSLTERAGPKGPKVDVYLPDEAPSGGVLLVHGGAFVIGSRDMKPARFVAGALAEAGFAVASCDYRTLPRGRLASARADVERSLAWWCDQEERFGVTRQSLMGMSAGGALALLASAAPPRPLDRVVAAFALYDLGALRGRFPALLGRLLVGGDRAAWSAASPLESPLGEAPLTILHGGRDRLTPLPQAEAYAARRRAAGLETELVAYANAPHGFFNDATSAIAADALRDLIAALEPRSVQEPASPQSLVATKG
ncbi:MAG: alpha/beta hydrolase [Planctomycetes bacterium]|nr:alpha/beta hydrolase [Planctomycetota bacterium]